MAACMPLLTPTTVLSSGPSLYLKKHALQGNRVTEVVYQSIKFLFARYTNATRTLNDTP